MRAGRHHGGDYQEADPEASLQVSGARCTGQAEAVRGGSTAGSCPGERPPVRALGRGTGSILFAEGGTEAASS